MAEYEAFRDVQTPSYLNPCSNCGRTFNPETLARHENVCTSQRQRKIFDSRKMRLHGTEAANVQRKASPLPTRGRHQVSSSSGKDKANWRAKHENLIATLKAARGQGPAVAAVVDPGYVACPYCNRNFNEYAAERHIPFCKEQSSRMPKGAGNGKTKLNKRTQYKPPLPGAKKNSSSNVSSESGTMVAKQRTPSNKASPNAGGVARRSSAPSPSARRKNVQDPTEQISQRPLRRQADASPQRQDDYRMTKFQEKNNNYSEQSKVKQKQQDNYNKENYAVAGENHSDSESSRIGSGKEPPSWLRDLKKTESASILPDRKSEAGSAGSKGRHSGRLREATSRDVFDFDEKPIKPSRRNSELDMDDFGVPISKATAVGVVHPSSRQLSDKNERTPSGRRKLANFCHECGTKYPVLAAKFCCECGLKRMHVEQA